MDNKPLVDMVRKLADELEICLEHRLLYLPDPEDFWLVKEARDLIKSYQGEECHHG